MPEMSPSEASSDPANDLKRKDGGKRGRKCLCQEPSPFHGMMVNFVSPWLAYGDQLFGQMLV